MAFCRLVLPFLVLCTVSAFANVQIPVYLWGDLRTSIKSNPLSSVPEDDFEAILRKELKEDPFTVIFIDETLSVEDFSRKNSDGETSFPYLHSNIGNAVYLPAVDDALDVLNRLADPEKVDNVKLTENGLSAEFEPESVKILFITLKDAREGESRGDMLRRHNDFMEEMFSKLVKEYKHVVAVYTARNPSWTVSETHSRVRRQAQSNSNDSTALNGLKFYTSRAVLTIGSTETNLTNFQTATSEIFSTNMSTTLDYGENALTLYFTQKMGYWFFSSVTVKQTSSSELIHLEPESEVYALTGFSYRCGQNVTFSSTNSTLPGKLLLQNIKVQPFFRDSSNETLLFGESVNCVGFFTVPIWSGLFVVFILLSITFYGIMMMMDIRTMDRFDDPKGKTITINAAE